MHTQPSIARRQIQMFPSLGQMAENGELVGDLVRATTRRCLISLLAEGLEPADARVKFCELILEAMAFRSICRPKFQRVMDTAIAHAEFLIFIEENQ